MKLLQKINSPADLKLLRPDEMKILCREIRDYIISVIPTIGGHFASSLGAVELTVALHYTYDAPVDKLVFDVGHQGYVHKILTGRREKLKRIRKFGGISGFLRRSESQYDVFGAGHASTSISAALGIAAARDMNKDDFHVVAIIGDGGMTGGLAYEGLNNAGMAKRNLTVILNDNEMSISPNVGAISHYLTKILTNPLYNKLRDEIWALTGKLSNLKEPVRIFAQKMEENLKNLLTPGMLFEDLGFKYFGPIDGHNLEECLEVFAKVKDIEGPNLVHVLTKKGKGYEKAEEDPVAWHGLKGPGGAVPKPVVAPSYSEVFALTLTDLAKSDKRVCVITAAMAEGTGLSVFRSEIPERFFDVGIAEGHAVTFAAGLATEKVRPVVAIYSTFLQRAFDHIIHDVCIQNLPVVFCLDRAGIAGEDGHTHHGYFDLSYLAPIPNLIVAAPANGNELRDLLYTAIQQTEHPYAIRFPKESSIIFDRDKPFVTIPTGSWDVRETGEAVGILAVGSMVAVGAKVRENLAAVGVNAGLVNCRFIKPMDEVCLAQLRAQYPTLITLEENVLSGGFGSRVADFFTAQGWSDTRFLHFGLPDQFITHGPRSLLLDEAGLSPDKLTAAIRRHLEAGGGRMVSSHTLAL